MARLPEWMFWLAFDALLIATVPFFVAEYREWRRTMKRRSTPHRKR